MDLTGTENYRGHPLTRTPDTEQTRGWWFVAQLRLHVKIHQRWRAEIWLEPEQVSSARLRIFDHDIGAEWLDALYPRGTSGVTPFLRADRFMLAGELPGWGEWPTEPTSQGRTPMPACYRCGGPVSHKELIVIVDPTAWAHELKTHRNCRAEHVAE